MRWQSVVVVAVRLRMAEWQNAGGHFRQSQLIEVNKQAKFRNKKYILHHRQGSQNNEIILL